MARDNLKFFDLKQSDCHQQSSCKIMQNDPSTNVAFLLAMVAEYNHVLLQLFDCEHQYNL